MQKYLLFTSATSTICLFGRRVKPKATETATGQEKYTLAETLCSGTPVPNRKY